MPFCTQSHTLVGFEMTVISLNSTPVGWARLKVLASTYSSEKGLLSLACPPEKPHFNCSLTPSALNHPNLMYYTPSLAMIQRCTIQRHFFCCSSSHFDMKYSDNCRCFQWSSLGARSLSVSLSTGKSSNSLHLTRSHCHCINLPLFHGNMAAVFEGGGKVFCPGALP